MSGNFWANRLGTAPAQAAPEQVPVAPPTQPWWVTPTPQQHVVVQQQPPAADQALTSPQGLVPPSQANGEQHFGDLISQQEYTTTKAQSAKDNERCPDCQSGNYVAPSGQPNMMKQCFNCGYNPRFQHSTHGISSTDPAIPVHTARGQTLSQNNFNPQKIIAHVG